MEQLVPIGRFSAMTRLSVRALRRYDEIGLLRPAEVDRSSGYRYYRLGQANEAEAIRLLRSAGLGLDAIGAVLAAPDPDAVAGVLDEHRRRLTAELADAHRRLALVERLINQEVPLMPYAVETRDVDAQTVAALRRTTDLASIGAVIGESFGALAGALGAGGVALAGMPFVVYHDVIDEETAGDVELCIPVADGTSLGGDGEASDGIVVRTVEGGPAATTVHQGPYEDIAPAYHVLTGWMQSHGHQPAGPPREVYLDDPTQVEPGTQRTEIVWPIT